MTNNWYLIRKPNVLVHTGGGQFYCIVINDDEKRAVYNINEKMRNHVIKYYSEMLDSISMKVIGYYKSESNATKMIVEEASKAIWEDDNMYIKIVDIYNKVFIINKDDGYTKDCIKALKNAGVKILTLTSWFHLQ